MSDATPFKPDKDFTKEADKVIPEAQELAKVHPSTSSGLALLTPSQTNVQKAIDKILGLEKQARQVGRNLSSL